MAKSKYREGASLKDKKNFERLLSEDEELVIATGFASTYMRQRFIIQLILPGVIFIIAGLIIAIALGFTSAANGILIGLFASAIFSFFYSYYIYHANRYLLTTRRVILKRGIISVKLVSALYDKITHIEVDQKLIDRMFLHLGTIKIHTAGAEKDELVLEYVENPIEFKNILERLINRQREVYGRQTGPVVTLEGELVED